MYKTMKSVRNSYNAILNLHRAEIGLQGNCTYLSAVFIQLNNDWNTSGLISLGSETGDDRRLVFISLKTVLLSSVKVKDSKSCVNCMGAAILIYAELSIASKFIFNILAKMVNTYKK